VTFDPRLIEIREPELLFGFGQAMPHPKDGLLLYGPMPSPLAGGRLRIGVISTANGLRLYKTFVDRASKPIAPARANDPNHTIFPGFQAVFGVDWPVEPAAWIEIDPAELSKAIRIQDRHQAHPQGGLPLLGRHRRPICATTAKHTSMSGWRSSPRKSANTAGQSPRSRARRQSDPTCS
jgi:hypothetical protein